MHRMALHPSFQPIVSLGTGAAVVGDGNFVDAHSEAGDFGGDLGFEAEAIFFDSDLLSDLAAKDFVASLHIREVGHHVGEHGEKEVSEK